MQKPNGYDQAESRQFAQNDKPPAGPYIMRILSAAEAKSREKNRPMLVLCLDIAQGQYSNNFRKLYDIFKSKKDDAKWPLVHRRCTDDNQLEYFKGDIKAIEESNEGFIFDFNEKSLNGKLVGAMLREKEIGVNQDGSMRTVLEVAFLCSTKKVLSGEMKPLPIKASNKPSNFNSSVGNFDQELLPF